MPFYEHVFIARQDVSAQQVEGLTEAFTTVITENGGKVAKTEYWGLRNLTYRMKKNRKGHYVLMNLDAPPAAVAEMERQMGINEDVVRLLTVRVEALEEGPSVVMQNRANREERSRRDDMGGGYGDRGYGPREGGRERGDRPRMEGRDD
jgi:small subunit ribosomal protein S6